MAKTANVYARVDPVVKEKAEVILSELGIHMSVCVEMMLRALVREERLPFEVRVARRKPLSVDEMTQEELTAEIEKGLDDIHERRTYSHEEVLDELNRRFGI